MFKVFIFKNEYNIVFILKNETIKGLESYHFEK